MGGVVRTSSIVASSVACAFQEDEGAETPNEERDADTKKGKLYLAYRTDVTEICTIILDDSTIWEVKAVKDEAGRNHVTQCFLERSL